MGTESLMYSMDKPLLSSVAALGGACQKPLCAGLSTAWRREVLLLLFLLKSSMTQNLCWNLYPMSGCTYSYSSTFSFSLITLINGTVEMMLCLAAHASGNQFLLSLSATFPHLFSGLESCLPQHMQLHVLNFWGLVQLVRGTRAGGAGDQHPMALGWNRVLDPRKGGREMPGMLTGDIRACLCPPGPDSKHIAKPLW